MMQKKMSPPTDIRPPSRTISQASIKILRRDAKKLLCNQLGGVSNEIIDYVLNRQQVVTPVVLERESILAWAARYRGAIQRAAVSYAEALAQLIGSRKGLGRKDLVWIRREAAAFLRTYISSRKRRHFVAWSLSGIAEIEAAAKADIFFNRVLAKYGKAPLIKPVRDKLADAQELYGRTKKNLRNAETLKPTPAQKVANPEAFPLMNAQEIAARLGVTRSTVARWADDGKLKRVGMGKTTGKRARLQITTQSVKKLLEESSE
jgi:excisionase family DNA binding protein